jgi:hypothetical protein
MILDFGNYRIITDDKQFITQEKRVKQENQFTKEENIGQEYYADLGYYTKLENALNSLGKRIILTNNDLKVILRELKLLQAKIRQFTRQLEIEEISIGKVS